MGQLDVPLGADDDEVITKLCDGVSASGITGIGLGFDFDDPTTPDDLSFLSRSRENSARDDLLFLPKSLSRMDSLGITLGL